MDSSNFAEYIQSVMPMAGEINSGYSAYSESLMRQQINESRNNGSDFVNVFFHYGNEYSRSPNEAQVNMSHASIDAGADVVLGSHAHITQGIEMYKVNLYFIILVISFLTSKIPILTEYIWLTLN